MTKTTFLNRAGLRYINCGIMAIALLFVLSCESKKQLVSDKVVEADSPQNGTPTPDKVYAQADEFPEFPGGPEGLRSYISKHIQYPAAAAMMGIQGKVYVQFVVEKDGSVSRAKILRGIDSSLNEEALRVVNSFPKWKPAKINGQSVAFSYAIPINFVL